jgi:hypothetical protein
MSPLQVSTKENSDIFLEKEKGSPSVNATRTISD